MSMTRRELVKAGALVAGGTALATAGALKDRLGGSPEQPTGPETIRKLEILKTTPPSPDEDVLVRMQRELVRAMARPVEARRWAMVIDTRKCVGCHACTIGCVAENRLPPGVVYRPVMVEEHGTYPNLRIQSTPRPCMQCEEPPCVPVCPVKATWRRVDGVVGIDYDRCIGCRYCLTACPYGARTSDFGERYTAGVAEGAPKGDQSPVLGQLATWEDQESSEYGKRWRRQGHQSPIGNARKCHFCLHRLQVGQLPVCTTTCIGRATYFGDLSDPDGLVTELTSRHNVQVLLPHKGTRPRVFYIV